MKIRTKILILIFCAYLITGAASIFIAKTIATNIIKDQVKEHLIAIALSHTNYIESLSTDYKKITEVLSVGNPAKDIVDIEKDIMITKPAMSRRIRNTILSQKTISRIRILNTNGIVLATSDSDIGMDQSKEEMFIKGMQNSYISDVHISRFTDKLVLSVSTPIILDSVVSGVCIVNFDVEEEFFKITTSRIGLGNTGEVYLVNENGMMITPSIFIHDAVLNQKVEIEHTADCVYVLPGTHSIQQLNISYCNSYTGSKVLRIHVHIPEVEWSLVVEKNEDEAFTPVKKLVSGLVLVFMFLFVIGTIVAIILANAISKPIIKLNNDIDEIKKGNLEYKVATKSKDEIGQLSRAFDEMTFRLLKSRRELETHAGKLEEQVKERTAELNKQFEKSEQQRIGTLNVLNDLDKINVNLKTEITQRKKAEEELEKHRNHLEELVKERTAELENANKELKRFNKLFVGREFRIKELKDKVKELEKELRRKKH